jgi:hypothetical protein
MALKRLSDTPQSAALGQPFVSPALPRMPAPPLGVMSNRSPLYLDFFWAHEHDIDVVKAPVYLNTGDLGRGKSTLNKAVMLRMGGRMGRPLGDGEYAPMRIRVHDRKRETGEPEYGLVVKHLHGRIVKLKKHGGINLFDPAMGMSEDDIISTATNIVEMISGISPLPRHQRLAIKVGVWKMLREKHDEVRPEVLEAKMMALTTNDVHEYFVKKNPYYEGNHIPESLFYEDSTTAASHLGEVHGGVYGGMFAGDGSIRDILSDYVVLLDWTGVSEEAKTLLSAMIWNWEDIALENGDEDILPDLEFKDEEHEALKNLVYARYMSSRLKKKRADRGMIMITTQYDTDLTMAGEPGSEIRKLCEGISNTIGGRFIARQPDKKFILDYYRELGFSELDVRAIPKLRRGNFFFHAQNFAPLPFRLDLTPIEKELVKTQAANRSMTTDILEDIDRWDEDEVEEDAA